MRQAPARWYEAALQRLQPALDSRLRMVTVDQRRPGDLIQVAGGRRARHREALVLEQEQAAELPVRTGADRQRPQPDFLVDGVKAGQHVLPGIERIVLEGA